MKSRGAEFLAHPEGKGVCKRKRKSPQTFVGVREVEGKGRVWG